jgi:formylmethanofuran dehydrogenase subunit D
VAKKIEVTLVSGRTIQQGMGLEIGKTSPEYCNNVTYVEISKSDSEELELKKDEPVEIVTDQGKVHLFWRLSEGLPPGRVFVPYGPWINQVIGTNTYSTGTPNFKAVRATISSAEGESVLSYSELIKKIKEGC